MASALTLARVKDPLFFKCFFVMINYATMTAGGVLHSQANNNIQKTKVLADSTSTGESLAAFAVLLHCRKCQKMCNLSWFGGMCKKINSF